MGTNSKIEWTNDTWNPWRGCTRVSAGCDNCYMMQSMCRFGEDPNTIVRAADKTFYAPLRKSHKTWKWPDGHKVFSCSWSDFFHPDADAYRGECWDIIRQRPGLTFQILTKRPERIAICLPDDWGRGYPNVWLGVTVENQAQAHLRIPFLLYTPAVRRFVSVEPMLESITFTRINFILSDWVIGAPLSLKAEQYNAMGWDSINEPMLRMGLALPYIDWVIIGAESGPKARKVNIEWIRALRNECFKYGTALFVKNVGIRTTIPADLAIQQFPVNPTIQPVNDPRLTIRQRIEQEVSARRMRENEIKTKVDLMPQEEIQHLSHLLTADIIRAYPDITSRDAVDMQRFSRSRIISDWKSEAVQ